MLDLHIIEEIRIVTKKKSAVRVLSGKESSNVIRGVNIGLDCKTDGC